MVTTRSRAVGLMNKQSSAAAAPSDKSRSECERGAQSEISVDANEDTFANCAPEEGSFYRNINSRASVGKGDCETGKNDKKEANISPLPSPLEESSSSSSSRFEEETSSSWSFQEEEQEEQEHPSTSGEKQSPEPQHEGQPVPPRDGNEFTSIEDERFENITRITSISVDMKYIEPEPKGVDAAIHSLFCSEVNQLIRCMRKKGWRNEEGDWSLELLSQGDEDETEQKWTAPTKKSDSKDFKLFLKQTVEIGNFFHAMPRGPASQSQALRERSRDIEARLCSMRHLAQRMKEQVLQVESRASRAGKVNHSRLVMSLRKRLVPVLVLILKEALLLGGSSTIREGNKPAEIGPEKGTFMACTLQCPLRIIGCIDQLWPVIRDSVDEVDHSQMFGLFDWHLSALRKLLLDGMERLKDIADRLRKILEGRENDKRIRQFQDEQRRRLWESQKTQLMYCFASSQQPIEEESRDYTSIICQGREGRKRSHVDCVSSAEERLCHDPEREVKYHEKYGWPHEEDLMLLRSIRRNENLDAEELVEAFPGRTVRDVVERIKVLKTRTREYFSKRGQPPPKWCY
ncbi:hypothetical protein E4U43_000546 [Claviceps pusilla]|uniref:Uncharacterized protein n=1 Tax=Claviceps pusilla TaxID=123648 RepID=A0A9P7SZY9_9HYPO|nr:hypothetical protein E4U43_000546 [Claviceps pusilla]